MDMHIRISGKIKYYLLFLCLAVFFLAFYYYYLSEVSRIYFVHYYEYFTRSVVLSHFLKALDLSSFFEYSIFYSTGKILVFKTIPFFILFGSSHFLFFYSNVILNLILLFFLFKSLMDILPLKRAFLFTFFIASNYFFLELLASFYVDLTFFLACSLFLVQLYKFQKEPGKNYLAIGILTFLLFAAKKTAYIFLLPTIFLAMIYLYFNKPSKDLHRHIIFFFSAAIVGFLFHLVVFFQGSLQFAAIEFDLKNHAFLSASFPDFISDLFSYIRSSYSVISYMPFFKFPGFFLNAGIYLLVFYNLKKKTNPFWVFLFFVGEIYFILLFNIFGNDSVLRYYLPFYFVYLYLAFDFLSTQLKKKRYGDLLIIGGILVLCLFGLHQMLFYPRYFYSQDAIIPYFPSLPEGSKMYAPEGFFEFFSSFIDSENRSFTYLASEDSRFNYTITHNISEADYLMCQDPPDNKIYKKIGEFVFGTSGEVNCRFYAKTFS